MNGTLVALAFVLLFVLLFMGVPIGTSLGIPVAILVAATQITSFEYIAQFLYTKIADFTMLSLPFFLLAGDIMDGGGLSKRMVAVANSLIGNVTGALGAVTVIACMFFGALTGSGMATTSAIGGMMIPEMKRKGYDSSYAATLVCFGGIVGPIIPPSLSFVLYGASTKTSVPDLFKAGIIPGVMIGLVFLMVNIIICKRTGTEVHKPELGPGGERIPMIQFWKERLHRVGKATKDGFWALLSPFIILGGIYSGFFTPTEAAAVSVVYSIIVSLFVYHDMTWKDLYKTFVSAAVLNGVTSFLLGTSTVFSTFMTFEQVPQMITNFMANLSDSPVVLLLVINVFLLIVGCFLDTVPAIIIIAPMLLPTIQAFNINPIHFGVVMSVNLAVGLCTPPYGCNLFVGAAVAKIKMESMLKWVVPFFLVSCVLLLILSFVPALSLAFV